MAHPTNLPAMRGSILAHSKKPSSFTTTCSACECRGQLTFFKAQPACNGERVAAAGRIVSASTLYIKIKANKNKMGY